MPLEVPSNAKTYTTVYDNFKGVDYTNDETHVYKRRSPSGLNMIPNLDGKPYKRKGWEIAINEADFESLYGDKLGSNFKINKLHWFEMAGCDHVMIFTTVGLYAYRATDGEADSFELLSTDPVLKSCFDRAFFFEAKGETGFYMYGEYVIWKYFYNEDTGEFLLEKQTPTIPRIRISVSADGRTASTLESGNLLTRMVAEEFQNNLQPYISSKTFSPELIGTTIDDNVFMAQYSAGTYTFTYKDGDWVDADGLFVTLPGLGITLGGTASEGSYITVAVSNYYRTYLAFNVTTENADQVKVFASDSEKDGKFGTELSVITGGTPSATQARLEQVEEDGETRTRLTYTVPHTALVDGEDAIRVEYPSVVIETTEHTYPETGYIEINVGGGA